MARYVHRYTSKAHGDGATSSPHTGDRWHSLVGLERCEGGGGGGVGGSPQHQVAPRPRRLHADGEGVGGEALVGDERLYRERVDSETHDAVEGEAAVDEVAALGTPTPNTPKTV